MTRRRPSREEVERLLREALADDLPAETEGRLRAGMRSSWSSAMTRVAAEESARGREPAGPPPAWSPQRALLAAAALLALAVGGVVHLEAGAGPLSESLLVQQTAARVASQLGRATAMSGRLETRDSRGRLVPVRIDWRDTGETNVWIEMPETTLHRTIRLPREAGSVSVLTRERPAPAASRTHEPDLGPARAFLAPERVAGLLAGQWERVPTSPGARPAAATFEVSTPGRPGAVRVTLDPATDLPISMERLWPEPGFADPGQASWTRADLDWTITPSPPTLFGGHTGPRATPDPFAGS